MRPSNGVAQAYDYDLVEGASSMGFGDTWHLMRAGVLTMTISINTCLDPPCLQATGGDVLILMYQMLGCALWGFLCIK